MELELSVRLSQRPVPPGCGQKDSPSASGCCYQASGPHGADSLTLPVGQVWPKAALGPDTLVAHYCVGTDGSQVHCRRGVCIPLFICALCCQAESRTGMGTELLLDEVTCSRRSWAGRHADLGPRGPGAGAWLQLPSARHPLPLPGLALPRSC